MRGEMMIECKNPTWIQVKLIESTLGFIGLVELYTTGLQPMAIHIQPLCGWLSILLMEKYLSNKPKDKRVRKKS